MYTALVVCGIDVSFCFQKILQIDLLVTTDLVNSSSLAFQYQSEAEPLKLNLDLLYLEIGQKNGLCLLPRLQTITSSLN